MPWAYKAFGQKRASDQTSSSISAPTDVKVNPNPRPQVTKTTYESNTVPIPASFLTTTPSDAHPITVSRIDFADTTLPEYTPYYATVLDNVLSATECADLLRLAEKSSPTGEWQPALLNAGAGYEVLMTDVRHCDRIVWDNAEIVKRIWDRCLEAKGINDELSRIENQPEVQGRGAKRGDRWKFAKVNERMRFLRYGSGNYFKSHCDGTYETPSKDLRSFYTLHLYLNDSLASGGELKGGATTFHSVRNEGVRLDVDPKIGRVLIFQHAHLLHSGDEVTQGIKYTMRSDLMYKRV